MNYTRRISKTMLPSSNVHATFNRLRSVKALIFTVISGKFWLRPHKSVVRILNLLPQRKDQIQKTIHC